MKEYPTGKAETTIGNVDWAWTEANHVYIGTKSGEHVTVRGVEYSASIHLFLVDGQWVTRNHHDLYVSRNIVDHNYSKPVSDAAKKTIRELYTAWWLGFSKEHAKLGVKAEQSHLQSEIGRHDEEIKELESKLADQRTLRQAACTKLEALNG